MHITLNVWIYSSAHLTLGTFHFRLNYILIVLPNWVGHFFSYLHSLELSKCSYFYYIITICTFYFVYLLCFTSCHICIIYYASDVLFASNVEKNVNVQNDPFCTNYNKII